MSRTSTNGRRRQITQGQCFFCKYDDQKRFHQCFDPSSEIIPSTTVLTDSNKRLVWQCIITYISSPTDLINLGRTSRFFYTLAESELSWSYLIRTKFGYRLWFRHVRQIFYQKNNAQINLHTDIETMDKIELDNECETIPTTFLHNRLDDQLMLIARAILRCYRYHLEKEMLKQTIFITPFELTVRQLTSFSNIHSERLSDVQRRTVPLTKLIYFYLADRRRVPTINFSIISPRGCITEIQDSQASIGRALSLNIHQKFILIHSFHSIMPGRYEIFWRLRFTSSPRMDDDLEFVAVPRYGLMTREHTSSEEFINCFKTYGTVYFRRSMGIITVFKRCTVFVGCIDLTQWLSRTTFVLDYIEMSAVV